MRNVERGVKYLPYIGYISKNICVNTLGEEAKLLWGYTPLNEDTLVFLALKSNRVSTIVEPRFILSEKGEDAFVVCDFACFLEEVCVVDRGHRDVHKLANQKPQKSQRSRRGNVDFIRVFYGESFHGVEKGWEFDGIVVIEWQGETVEEVQKNSVGRYGFVVFLWQE